MKRILAGLAVILALPCTALAQRIQQPMARSVVAVIDNSLSSVLVTWRKLAQEPEDCTYNLYKRTSGTTDYTKVNSSAIKKTNYQTTLSTIPYGTELAVTMVSDGVESDKSEPFLFEEHDFNNVFFDFDFETSVLTPDNYKVKYAWPMDLDGNGEFDAILVDRLYSGGYTDPNCDTSTDKLQAYTLDGTCLWTIDIGPNVDIDNGQNDMVLAYDINCDGRCEVIIRSSDGTRFWDADNDTWGLYVMGATDGDTDGDGITDYRSSSTMNAPFYISVVNGSTGAELECSELQYDQVSDGSDQYSRTNRADYYNDNDGTEYAFMAGQFAICYFDGIHPSLAMKCLDRTTDGTHHNYVFVWSYDWTQGVPSNWHHSYTWSRNDKSPWPAEFHQLRVADTDGDGIDEVIPGGFGVNPEKGMVFSAGIGHGDRFDVSDIDPDRPGMEIYAIQQSNLLGQVLYDAATGDHILEWYLSAVGDVGRGRSMDVDASVKGYEIFSTMDNLYDCHGNIITEGSNTYPVEGSWWNGDLQRELLSSSGGSNYATNIMVQTYSGSRLIEFSKQSSWAVHSGTAVRPAFMGDMTGDWREEVVLMKQDADTSTGLVGYSTDLSTNYSIHTLQQDPHYRLDCTTRGYYQMPCTGFYLGGGMPTPPLPPSMVTDFRWSAGSSWDTSSSAFTTFDQTLASAYSDGTSVIFDISGDNSLTIALSGTLQPSAVYIMNPKEHDYTFGGSGTLSGDMDLWKSMQGTATFDTDLAFTGTTIVSEGTLRVNGTISGPVDIRARGTLAGNATLNGDVTFEGALNYEGCRLMPGSDDEPYGTMTFGQNLTLPGDVYVVLNVADGKSGCISVNGNLTLEGSNTFTINITDSTLTEGEFVLAQCTDTLTADSAAISTIGLEGRNYDISVSDNQIILTIHATRDPLEDVTWTGAQSALWDYKTENFQADGEATAFVSGDTVVFDDQSDVRTITVDEQMLTGGITFSHDSGEYTLSGDGGISGDGGLTLNGQGTLTMDISNSYTGPTIVNSGTLVVSSLSNGGMSSTIGASTADEGNLQLGGGTLRMTATNMATDHIITLTDTSTVVVTQSNGSLTLNGMVTGSGYLVKEGPGQLNLGYGGTNPFAGMIIREGLVAQAAWNTTFGSDGSPMVLAGGGIDLIDVNSSSTRPIFNHSTTIVEGTDNTISGTVRGAINGSFHGTGNLTILSDGVRNDIGADFSDFQGTLTAQGSSFRLMDDVTDMSQTTLILDEGCYVGHYKSNNSGARAITTKIGSLSSSTSDCTLGNGSDSYLVGYLGVNETYRGVLAAASVTKYGDGVWTLTACGSTSNVVVNAGTLQLYNNPYASSPEAFTSGTLTVASGATVSGVGCMGDATIKKGGTVSAGYNGGYGTLKATGTVTMSSGSRLVVKIGVNATGKDSNDKFKFSGTLKHSNDTIVVEVGSGRTLTAGDEISIFTGDGTNSGTYILKTVSDELTIEWDDSDLLTEGILRVASVETTAIGAIPADDTEVDVFRTDGIRVRSNVRYAEALDGLAPGIYIVNGRTLLKQ